MANIPQCSPTPPDLTQSHEIIKHLLAIEVERLATAVRIERERGIVFPETSVIIHDIVKLNRAVNDESDGEGIMPEFDLP